MRIVAISDTHGHHRRVGGVPDGDVFIHCGDYSDYGEVEVMRSANQWIASLSHRYKFGVYGNHDITCDRERPRFYVPEASKALAALEVLDNEEISIGAVNFYGVPYCKDWPGWSEKTFTRSPGEMEAIFSLAPTALDVLITHGPPFGILDMPHTSGEHLGCPAVLSYVKRVRPKVVLFGHIHGGFGRVRVDGTEFVNCAFLGEPNTPLHRPVVIDL
jgi:Icc-related predicted phosphoesterase